MLIDLLRRGAADVPDLPVVVSPGRTATYGECLADAETLARGLRRQGVRRFACAVDDVAGLLALLCASSATGCEACVYPEGISAAQLDTFSKTFEHDIVVADHPVDARRARVVRVEALVEDGLDATRPPGPPPPSSPVLILTTGTTGLPKGARHEWSRLIASAARPREDPRDGGARWLLAYGLNQFAGLQVAIHALASRSTLVAGANRQPRAGLDAIRQFGVTHVSATPTFWRMILALLDGHASVPLEQITLGGEAVPDALLDDLRARFPGARISQIYAATEFGSGVSVRDGKPGLPLSVLARPASAPVQMRVVDGELHIRSSIGMLGYFGGETAGEDTSDDWRPTGDLVELRGDRLHFVGRASERINVGGAKVDPISVERAVSRVDGVELARAYGRSNPVTGQIVALDVVPRAGSDEAGLHAAIREACVDLPSAARPRRIRFVAELELRGQKVVRGHEGA